eukprot:gene25663-biopygen22149
MQQRMVERAVGHDDVALEAASLALQRGGDIRGVGGEQLVAQQFAHGDAGHLASAAAKPLPVGLVGKAAAQAAVPVGHHAGNAGGQGVEETVAFPQLRFGGAPFAQVGRHAEKADDLARLVAQGRDRQQHGHEPPIAVEQGPFLLVGHAAQRFDGQHLHAGRHGASQRSGQGLGAQRQLGRVMEEQGRVLPDEFVGRIAEQAFRRWIEQRHQAGRVAGDDGVAGIVEDDFLQRGNMLDFLRALGNLLLERTVQFVDGRLRAFCALMSRTVLAAPMTAPSALRMGETVTETSSVLPSRRRRRVSKPDTTSPRATRARICLSSSCCVAGTISRSSGRPMACAAL